jgi:uncharacterized protein (TIGR03435 family)
MRAFLMRAMVVCLIGASLFVSAVHAQIPGFDVASVKASHSDSERGAIQMAKGSLTITNAPLRKIVGAAFGIGEDRDAYSLAGPGWMVAERYDVAAKFPAATSADQVWLMLQALLKERFGMRFHREMREAPAYVLVVGKDGLKARPAAAGSAGGFNRRSGHLESRSATMAGLADKLSQQSDRPVVDKTGVGGAYEFTLDWTPDDLQSDGQAGPSLFTAIEEQLGLKLEARKEPMEVVVVDYVERIPSGN